MILLVLAAQVTVPPPGPPPPPAMPAPVIDVATAGGVRVVRRMLAWMPGEVRCGAMPVAAVQWRRPYQALAWSSLDPKPVTYGFRLDATGRPLSIARADGPGYVFGGEDIAPSLAASRFAAGAERRTCSVTFAPRLTTLSDTPVADLVSYTLTPTNGPLPPDGWAAIFPASATCKNDPKPAPLTQIYPDQRTIGGTPGNRDWTMIGYDTDPSGSPIAVQVLTGTGNAALDAAGAAAIRASRYTEGPRTGCRLPFVRGAEILSPPPIAAKSADEPAACEGEWTTKPPLRYPAPYRRRSIEGWAVVGFDIAPWGATGNVRVIAAEPAAEFGEQAAALIRQAKRAPSEAGVSGCIERVHFRMEKQGEPANTDG